MKERTNRCLEAEKIFEHGVVQEWLNTRRNLFPSFSLLMHDNGKEAGCVVISTLCAR